MVLRSKTKAKLLVSYAAPLTGFFKGKISDKRHYKPSFAYFSYPFEVALTGPCKKNELFSNKEKITRRFAARILCFGFTQKGYWLRRDKRSMLPPSRDGFPSLPPSRVLLRVSLLRLGYRTNQKDKRLLKSKTREGSF